MHSDDELRARLVRERAQRTHPRQAGAVLAELRPAMRRARRRRIVATSAAATIALGGLAAAGQVVRTERSATVRISSDTAQTDNTLATYPTVTIDDRDDDPAVVRADPETDSQPAPTDGDPSDHTDTPDVATAVPTAPHPDDAEHDDDHNSQDLESSTSTVPVATTIDEVPNTTVAAQQPLPTTAAASIERFEVACGYVLAIRSADSVELVEVTPIPGYNYRLEDPDNGAITVQFSGTGEDCELKIPTTAGESHSD